MWATLLTHAIAAFVGVTIWEMGKKVAKDYKESRKKSRWFDPHDFIYH